MSRALFWPEFLEVFMKMLPVMPEMGGWAEGRGGVAGQRLRLLSCGSGGFVQWQLACPSRRERGSSLPGPCDPRPAAASLCSAVEDGSG